MENNSTPFKPAISLTVIGGYLGAGKTTLLNQLLHSAQEQHLAVLVNDFGEISIDSVLIEHRSIDTIALSNGCICCSIAGDLAMTLFKLRELAVPPHRVIIEASGVSDPHKIAQYGHLPGFHLDSIVVVVDAETILDQVKDSFIGETVVRQLLHADVLILNKVDLISNVHRLNVNKWLRELDPGSRIVEVTYGNVPWPLLLGDDVLRSHQNNFTDDYSQDHQHGQMYETWSYTSSSPLDGDKFRAVIANLSKSILRAKGIIFLREDISYRFVFQLVGKRWSIKRDHIWSDKDRPCTQIVFIGSPDSFDSSQLERMLDNCSSTTE